MGKQHRSFGKDMDMLAEAYNESALLGGKHLMHTGTPEAAADALAADDGYNSPEEAAEDQIFGLVDASGNIVSLYDNEGIMRQVMEGRPDLKAITYDELPFNVDVT